MLGAMQIRGRRALWLTIVAITIVGCGDDAASDGDAGVIADAATIDATSPDAGRDDATTPDAAAADDADVALDAASEDAAVDAGIAPDAGSPDAGSPDAGSLENGGDTCELARDVTAGGTFLGQSTRAPATDTYGPMGAGCPSGGAASGRDVAYLVRPTLATSYRVRVVPSAATPTYDPMLYAVRTCGGAGCVAGTVLNGPGAAEEITFAVVADETVYIVVDGELASSGDFDLTVTLE